MPHKLKWFHCSRLIRLADKLEGKGPYAKIGPVPPHKFDMQYLFADKKGGDCIGQSAFDPHQCNTAACALGWAKSDPWFINIGLGSTANFFGMDQDISNFNYLFMAYNYPAERYVNTSIVAARIRRLAAS